MRCKCGHEAEPVMERGKQVVADPDNLRRGSRRQPVWECRECGRVFAADSEQRPVESWNDRAAGEPL